MVGWSGLCLPCAGVAALEGGARRAWTVVRHSRRAISSSSGPSGLPLACIDGYSAPTVSSMIEPLAVVTAYLAGPVAFAYIIARAKGRIDIRNVDIGNVGAGSVMRAVGLREGIVVLVADIARGTGVVAVCGQSSDASKKYDLRTRIWRQGGRPQNDYR